MKISIWAALLATGLSFTINKVQAADLTITIDGLRNSNGHISLCVFSSEASDPNIFPDCDKGKPVKSGKIKISGNRATVTYTGLKDGSYAVAMIHDENANGKLDTNFVSVPTEGLGVSNNPTLYGKPNFKDAQFTLAGKKTINITAKYFL